VTAESQRPLLRGYRLKLGWTQQEMAERLVHLAWMRRREQVAVNADMIAKWERGVKGISPRYRELLCHLFGVTADQLGLKNTPVAATAREMSPGGDESLISMVDNAARLLDQLGAAGTALAPHMLHAWKDTVTTRHTMLGLLDPAASDPVGHARAATASLIELEHLAERYQVLYETADPAALMTPLAAHLRMTAEALRRDPAPEQRLRLLRNQARVAILAGRLAAEDLGTPMSGRAYYSLACDTLRETGDHHLTALAHGHAAQLAAAEAMTTAALTHLTTAAEHACSTPALASWLASLEATIHADRGDHTAARQALQRAHATLSTDCSHPSSPNDRASVILAAATGHVLLQAGDHTSARDTLTTALDQLHPTARRHRVLVLVDLATAELHSDNPSAACSRATQAADLLHQAAYAFGAARLRAFRAAAQRPLSSKALHALDEHLSRIAA
jgi:transcriptional regulator with XRE-family HTH domain